VSKRLTQLLIIDWVMQVASEVQNFLEWKGGVCPEVLFCTEVSVRDASAHPLDTTAPSGLHSFTQCKSTCAPQVIQYDDTVCTCGTADTQMHIVHRPYSRGRIRSVHAHGAELA
jgi:hypothetical protein